MQAFIRNWLPVIGYCTLIFVQSSFPTYDQLPSFEFSDKLLHFIAYGIMALLFCRAFSATARWRRRKGMLFVLGVLAATVFGLTDEWHQAFVPGRSAELADAAADFAGSLAGSWIYIQCLHRKLGSHTP